MKVGLRLLDERRRRHLGTACGLRADCLGALVGDCVRTAFPEGLLWGLLGALLQLARLRAWFVALGLGRALDGAKDTLDGLRCADFVGTLLGTSWDFVGTSLGPGTGPRGERERGPHWDRGTSGRQKFSIFYHIIIYMALQIAGGSTYTCVVVNPRNTTSKVYLCGNNANGHLGNGFGGNIPFSPTEFITGITATAVACGETFTTILLSDGTVRTTSTSTSGLEQITGITTATAVACGNRHTIIRLSDGTVRTFGNNIYGQLGLGYTGDPQTSPQQITGITTATAVACGYYHTIILLSDGTVRTFGYNLYGQLGLGNTTTPQTSPQQITGITTATAMAGGGLHTIIRLSDGTVRTFGYNDYGQLGLGDLTQRTSPTQITGITTATAVACGDRHTIILLSDGTVQTFGRNSNGQLGVGPADTTNRSSPVAMLLTMGFKSSGSVSFSEIATYFGGTTPHSLSEYYGIATGVPTSGAISVNNFYGKI